MSIEKKFKSYLAAYDGTPRDFATMESQFDEMSHPDFVLHQSDGSTVTREQMKQTHANLFEAGTKVDLLYFKQNPSTIEFKFRMTNGQCDFTIHNIATLQDGKIIKEEPADTSKPQKWINFESYLAAFDGTPKSFSEVEQISRVTLWTKYNARKKLSSTTSYSCDLDQRQLYFFLRE
jgi:phenylpropionate dioxygenase-like ring-hydroxylating dioxygenase large terminal subunit